MRPTAEVFEQRDWSSTAHRMVCQSKKPGQGKHVPSMRASVNTASRPQRRRSTYGAKQSHHTVFPPAHGEATADARFLHTLQRAVVNHILAGRKFRYLSASRGQRGNCKACHGGCARSSNPHTKVATSSCSISIEVEFFGPEPHPNSCPGSGHVSRYSTR